MQALQPNALLGPYRLVRLLAQGGMGQVFLAEGPEGEVVIKVLQPELAVQSEMRSMFLHEARLGSTLSHPCIARIYDYGDAEGVLYLAMEYVDGPPLSTILRRLRRRLPLESTLEIVANVAGALGHAHAAVDDRGEPLRIVHRDVTPQNILISRAGAVKLIDFGVARSAGQDHRTRTGVLKGKLAYMAPEQFRGKVNNQTDIFALGVVLHELVSGRRLFRRPTEAETFAAILVDPLPPLRASDETAAVLQPIVDRALARELPRRYLDARHFEAELRGAMERLGARCPPEELAALAVFGGSEIPGDTDRPTEADVSADVLTSTSGLRLRPEDVEELSDLSDLYFSDTVGAPTTSDGTAASEELNRALEAAARAHEAVRGADVDAMLGKGPPPALQARIPTETLPLAQRARARDEAVAAPAPLAERVLPDSGDEVLPARAKFPYGLALVVMAACLALFGGIYVLAVDRSGPRGGELAGPSTPTAPPAPSVPIGASTVEPAPTPIVPAVTPVALADAAVATPAREPEPPAHARVPEPVSEPARGDGGRQGSSPPRRTSGATAAAGGSPSSAAAAATEPSPEAAAVDEATPGRLSVGLRGGWAIVRLDGQTLSETPVTGVEVRPGVHTLELRLNGTGEPKRVQIRIEPGMDYRRTFDVSELGTP